MKRLGKVWQQITAFDNLYAAFLLARKGKRGRDAVIRFELDLERELLQLQSELKNGSYYPSAYRQFLIHDRKPRLISAAPFRDRVVHHALMLHLEAWLDRRFIHHSYACRKGKGVHKAVDQYQRWAQRYAYVLKLDIRRYFPSIDHQILKTQLHRQIKDQQLFYLLELIIDASPNTAGPAAYFPGDDLFTQLERRRGIPIGNLTSQVIANLYLNDLDHWLVEKRRQTAYLRYVDDLFLLGNDIGRLWELKQLIADSLAELRLSFHPSKVQVMRTSERVDVLGYKVSRTRRWLRNDNGWRFRRKCKSMEAEYASHDLDLNDIKCRVNAWIGHARHAQTQGLRREIFKDVVFQRQA